MKLKQKLIQIENEIASLQYQSKKEEVVNSLIHGVGVFLSITALVFLVVFANIYGTIWHVVSFSVFGATLIFLYLSSTLFHGFQNTKLKKFFRLFDYIGIFLLIAGTYTPITLVYLHGPWGWSLLGIVWFLALIGIVLRLLFSEKIELILAVLYVLMGWIILVALKPMLAMVPTGVIIWLVIGGAFYMLGLLFLSFKKIPYHHAIWHLFVLGGSTAHFLGMFLNIQN